MICSEFVDDSFTNTPHEDAMVPSTISWVHYEDQSTNGGPRGGLGRQTLVDSSIMMKAESPPSRIEKPHLIAEDAVWWEVIRRISPLSYQQETTLKASIISSTSLSSSFSMLSSSEEETAGAEQDVHLLDQACEIMMSTIHNDDSCQTLEQAQNKITDLQTAPEEDSADDALFKVMQYRRDLLTDDLGMFQEQLKLSRSSTTPKTVFARNLKLYQGTRRR